MAEGSFVNLPWFNPKVTEIVILFWHCTSARPEFSIGALQHTFVFHMHIFHIFKQKYASSTQIYIQKQARAFSNNIAVGKTPPVSPASCCPWKVTCRRVIWHIAGSTRTRCHTGGEDVIIVLDGPLWWWAIALPWPCALVLALALALAAPSGVWQGRYSPHLI